MKNNSLIISEQKPVFGIAGYKMPNPSKSFFFKPTTFKIIASQKKEKDNYITDFVRAKQFMPSPAQYQPQQDKSRMLID